ncbi:ribosomal oxygenase 2 [Oncorhynchus clarkii lewisi]|uniref:ribosomal oxygenase 2 n=1 Tax=Oncorhynchus clarkii lewisi TaxID=490388 RepID=UPI0039B9120D
MPRKGRKAASGDEEVAPKHRKTDSNGVPSPFCFDTPDTVFQSLISPVGQEEFFTDYWEKKPLHLQRSDPGLASYYKSLFQLSDLKGLCAQGLTYARDLNVCRSVQGNKTVLNKEGRVNYSQLKKDFNQKATIQFHQPQRFKDELWRIQEKLECFFGALVGSNVYITPQDSQGLPPHYDDVEVFILQLEGEKHWRLYSPTVPLAREYCVALEERIGSPTHDIILKAGDLLYFPRGTIHQADTPVGVDHSTHLTLSTYQNTSWGDYLANVFPNFLYDSLKTSDITRRVGMPRRILMGANAAPDTSRQLASLLRSVADQMERGEHELRAGDMKRDFALHRLPPYTPEQDDISSSAGKMPALEDTVCLRFKDHILVSLETCQSPSDGSVSLVVDVMHSLRNRREKHMMGQSGDDDDDDDDSGGDDDSGEEEEDAPSETPGMTFPFEDLPAIRQLQAGQPIPVSQLKRQLDNDKVQMALVLWSEGLLEVC